MTIFVWPGPTLTGTAIALSWTKAFISASALDGGIVLIVGVSNTALSTVPALIPNGHETSETAIIIDLHQNYIIF